MAVEEHYLHEAQLPTEREQGLDFYLSIIRRRWAFFLVPFVGALCVGVLVAVLLPAVYRSEARILVQSQQIPVDLVKPTVTAGADERIQVITQRIMTRDNLTAIANKFQMFPKWRGRMSDTDLVDLMRERTSITPIALTAAGRNPNSSTIAFTVGFEYEDPQVTMRVANELVTLILNEDVRARTSRAIETTKFLAQEADRLENERIAVEAQIDQLKDRSGNGGTDEAAQQIATLKADLLQKSAIYSNSHPEIKALKERIRALERPDVIPPAADAASQAKDASTAKPPSAGQQTNAPTLETSSLSFLESKQKSVQEDLDKAREKLLAARQGQRLEEDQQSERFEVIEQPSSPQEPVKPNRKKILAMGFAAAMAAGIGGIFAIEFYDKTLRGPADLPVPPRFVVTVPYIATRAELAHAKRRLKIVAAASAGVFILGLAMFHWLVMPLDLLLEKLTDRLLGV